MRLKCTIGAAKSKRGNDDAASGVRAVMALALRARIAIATSRRA